MGRVNHSTKSVTLESATQAFANELRRKLKRERIDGSQQESYCEAITHATKYCKHAFEPYGVFGGQFTSHGPDHSGRVLWDALLLAKRAEPALTANECFVLGVAAILHDVGMTAPLPIAITQACADEDRRWLHRRERHAEATVELLKAGTGPHLGVLRDVDRGLYEDVLPHVCAAHTTTGFHHHVALLRTKAERSGGHERYAMLAGILLLADELDIACERARPDKQRYHELKTPLTKAHWWKHWLIAEKEVDGDAVRIVYAPETCRHGSEEFLSWTTGKLLHQLKSVRRALDPNGNDRLWRLVIEPVPADSVYWDAELPDLTDDVVECAKAIRLKLPGQKPGRVIRPQKLGERVPYPHEIRGPSEFFRLAIGQHIAHFRGQGQHVPPREARRLYVEHPSNMELMDHAMTEWRRFVEGETPGVNLKVFVGEVGVGKTHFLSAFLAEVETRHPDLHKSTLLVRAELTERNQHSLLDAQRRVARSLYEELHNRLNIANEIREIMKREYRPGVLPQVPSLAEEIESWNEEHIHEFVRVIGMICRPDSGIHAELKERAPLAMCIFMDNSDQLAAHVVHGLYNWCNNVSGEASALLWIFMRPETFSRLQERQQRSPIQLRGPEPIYAPSLHDVVKNRIRTFPDKFKPNELVAIPYKDKTFTPSSVQDAVEHVAGLAMKTTEDMLPKLTDRPLDAGQPNIRAGLQGLLGILGSPVMSDKEYVRALLLRRIVTERDKVGKKSDSALKRWSKVLEALILGRRVWFSSTCGAVENLLDPPNVEQYGDYLLLVHCLQRLSARRVEHPFGQFSTQLARLGYSPGRVQEAIRHLASRHVIMEDGDPNEDPFVRRTFPLVVVHGEVSAPYRDSTIIAGTPWGEYHVEKLVEQAQYWKHIYYDIVVPDSLGATLDPAATHGSKAESRAAISTLLSYLIPIEASWLHNVDEHARTEIGVRAILERIRDKIVHQLK